MRQALPGRALAIKRAATIVGGLDELARRLKLPERQLDYWMRDIGTPPDSVFFDVIDVIIQSAGTRPGGLVEAGRRDWQARDRDPFVQ
jgi:hypothetical protein